MTAFKITAKILYRMLSPYPISNRIPYLADTHVEIISCNVQT